MASPWYCWMAAAFQAAGAQTLPGSPFFQDLSSLISTNPAQLNYGVSVTDIDADGQFEAVVAGYGFKNQAYKWSQASGTFVDAASGQAVLQAATAQSIGVAACDVDGDGYEELYVLNTDSYSGAKVTADMMIDRSVSGTYSDMFALSQNLGSKNLVAGRSACCVDRCGSGLYGTMVAAYGGPMRLYEVSPGSVITDVAVAAGLALTTGGRALVGGPIVSNRFDILANNEGWQSTNRPNFLFVNQGGEGTFLDHAAAMGILDSSQTGRGTALLDSNGDGLLDIVYGNWNGPHRLFIQQEDSQGCVTFVDRAPAAMAAPSRIRTVIVADFDNDGYEEILYNNIPGDNRLFRKLPTDATWVQINMGDAIDSGGYGTGGAVGDFDGDGQLELFISHGESVQQPVSYYRPLLGSGNHWLRILPKTAQGAPARGALVTLVAGSRAQTRVIDPGSGYLCQMEPVAHFGLGSLTTVASVTVQWPDGMQKVLTNVTIDQLLVVQKPSNALVIPPYQITLSGSCLKRVRPGMSSSSTSSAAGSATGSSGQNSATSSAPTTSLGVAAVTTAAVAAVAASSGLGETTSTRSSSSLAISSVQSTSLGAAPVTTAAAMATAAYPSSMATSTSVPVTTAAAMATNAYSSSMATSTSVPVTTAAAMATAAYPSFNATSSWVRRTSQILGGLVPSLLLAAVAW